MTAIETLARTAARAAWATYNAQPARVPRYPALPAWMALSSERRRLGQADKLDRTAHREFVAAYQAELDELSGGAR